MSTDDYAPVTRQLPEPERLSDYAAMNAIARVLMDNENWSSNATMDTVEEITQIVLQTGRDWED